MDVTYSMQRRGQRLKQNDWVWWLAIILLLCSATPVGLILLFVYLNRGKKADKQRIPEKTGHKEVTFSVDDVFQSAGTAVDNAMHSAGAAVDEAMRSVSDAINEALGAKSASETAKTSFTAEKSSGKRVTYTYTSDYAQPKRAHKPKKPISRGLARLKVIAGSILAGGFTLLTVSEFFHGLSALSRGYTSVWDLLSRVIPLSLFACLGGILALWGYFGTEKARRFERYRNLIQPERATLSVYALADALQLRYNRVCDDLDEMIDRGYFPFAYLDRSQGRLVLSPDYVDLSYAPRNPAQVVDPPVSDETPAPSPAVQDDDMLSRIHAANEAISDPTLSAKIDEIESLTRKILQLVEERPEKADSIHRFTGYYLPQTLKLAEFYARVEAQGVEGENISAAKEKINDAMDMLISGYRQQLDQLFQDDVVDITADIAVMEQMLARDGLSPEELQPERRK